MARVQAPWPQQEELLTSYSAQVGMSGRSGTPGASGQPARRQGQHSKAHLPQPSAWAQPEPAASRGSATGMPSGGGAAQMPRVSQPLRVEPPVEFNSPRRTAIGKAAGKPSGSKASQLKDVGFGFGLGLGFGFGFGLADPNPNPSQGSSS